MTNEDGSFDYSQMGRRPKIIIEAFALQLMKKADVDIPALRERLLGMSGDGVKTEIRLATLPDARPRDGKGPGTRTMTCRRIMKMDSDEIVVVSLDVGHGLIYKGDQRWMNHARTDIVFTVTGQSIPETIINQACGEPLTSLIRHEILDDDSFIIRDIVNGPTGVQITIVPSWIELA